MASTGQRCCSAREFQNSIEDSSHALISEEIDRLEAQGFDIGANTIKHTSGGSIFQKGLARNPLSIKSIVADLIWIDEGETLSAKTLKALSASFRISAAKKDRASKAGKEAAVPDILISMNRGSSHDPISKEYLKDAETDLAKQGYHINEHYMVVEINWDDIPKAWFESSGLEPERASDEKRMSTAEYDHKWGGAYSDTIDNAIIKPEWFDACVDAHEKLSGMGDWGMGQRVVSFDPADAGDDPEALAYMEGNIIMEAMQADQKDIDLAQKWACSYANEKRVDAFTWDCDGMGVGLKGSVESAFNGTRTKYVQFKGGHGAHNPDDIYEENESDYRDDDNPKTNKEAFRNQRSQFYFELANAMKRTYLAVKDGRNFDTDKLISFNGTIRHLDLLRSELCRIPRKYVAGGRYQLMTKPEMVAMGIASPNIADCIMMLRKPINVEPFRPPRLGGVKWG